MRALMGSLGIPLQLRGDRMFRLVRRLANNHGYAKLRLTKARITDTQRQARRRTERASRRVNRVA